MYKKKEISINTGTCILNTKIFNILIFIIFVLIKLDSDICSYCETFYSFLESFPEGTPVGAPAKAQQA